LASAENHGFTIYLLSNGYTMLNIPFWFRAFSPHRLSAPPLLGLLA